MFKPFHAGFSKKKRKKLCHHKKPFVFLPLQHIIHRFLRKRAKEKKLCFPTPARPLLISCLFSSNLGISPLSLPSKLRFLSLSIFCVFVFIFLRSFFLSHSPPLLLLACDLPQSHLLSFCVLSSQSAVASFPPSILHTFSLSFPSPLKQLLSLVPFPPNPSYLLSAVWYLLLEIDEAQQNRAGLTSIL